MYVGFVIYEFLKMSKTFVHIILKEFNKRCSNVF